MGRPSGTRASSRQLSSKLRTELQAQLEAGRCAYCRTPARPNRPLTREHVIPQARGGRRKDIRIIVPACARCNQSRGCREFVPFLLKRPCRISSFLDYLAVLSPESARQIDSRIFAELYVAVAIMRDAVQHGRDWKQTIERLARGRSLHRRRYAARRAVRTAKDRIAALRSRSSRPAGPSCLLPAPRTDILPLHLEESPERLASRLLSVLAMAWQVPGELAERELMRALSGTAVTAESLVAGDGSATADGDIDQMDLRLDRSRRGPKRKRLRVDDRRGGSRRNGRQGAALRGRAA